MNKQKCEFCEFAQMIKDNNLPMQPIITLNQENREARCYFHLNEKMKYTAKYCPYCGKELK